MKRTTLLLLLLVGCRYCTAQPRLGVVAGGVLGKTTGTASKFRPGLYAGIELGIPLTRLVSLQAEPKYILKGENIDPEGKGIYHYLELPLNCVYHILTPAGRLSIGGGPFVAYMIKGAWTRLDGSTESIDFNYDKVNQFDFGLNAVAGFEIKKKVFINLNYSLGLVDVWTADYIGKNKTRSLGLGVGILF